MVGSDKNAAGKVQVAGGDHDHDGGHGWSQMKDLVKEAVGVVSLAGGNLPASENDSKGGGSGANCMRKLSLSMATVAAPVVVAGMGQYLAAKQSQSYWSGGRRRARDSPAASQSWGGAKGGKCFENTGEISKK